MKEETSDDAIEYVETFLEKYRSFGYKVKPEARTLMFGYRKEQFSLAQMLVNTIRDYEDSKSDMRERQEWAWLLRTWIDRAIAFTMIEENPNSIRTLTSRNVELINKIKELETDVGNFKEQIRELKYENKRLATAIHLAKKPKSQKSRDVVNPLAR